jgi:subtilisin family serine protease
MPPRPAPRPIGHLLRRVTAAAVVACVIAPVISPEESSAASQATAVVVEVRDGKPVVRRVSAKEAARLRKRGVQTFPNRKVRLFDDVEDTEEEIIEVRPCPLCYVPSLYATGRRTVVAVIDSGVDPHHATLRDSLVPGANFVPEDGLGEIPWSDGEGHGTHVAGVVLQADPTAQIMPVRVVDREGAGEAASIAEGIVWAVDNGAKVLNLSLGAEADEAPENGPLHLAVRYAIERDVVVVAAAGNSGEEGSPANYPAAWPEVIAVAASEEDSSFSNRGSYVDIAARGLAVRSAALGGGTVSMTGTSMASPRVAGAAAALRTLHPEWTAADVRDQLLATSDDAGKPGPDGVFGHGIVNARRAAETQLQRPTAVVPAARRTKAAVKPAMGGIRITAPKGAKVTFVETADGFVSFTGRSDVFPATSKTKLRIWSYDKDGEPTAPLVRVVKPTATPRISLSVTRTNGVVKMWMRNAAAPGLTYMVYFDKETNAESAVSGATTSFSVRNTTAKTVKLCWNSGFLEFGCQTAPIR